MATRPLSTRGVSRRTAIKSLSLGTAGLSAGVWSALAPRTSLAANDTLQIACIGVANRAADNISGVSGVAGQSIVALCDIDDTFLDRLTKPTGEPAKQKPPRFADVRVYHDYRELLDKEAGKVDAVVTIGCVIEGATSHDDIVVQHAARKIIDLSLEFGKPVTLGISGPGMTRLEANERIDYAKRAVESAIKLVQRLK